MRIGTRIHLVIPWLLLASLGIPSHVLAADKVTVGCSEEVLLLPWGIRIRARVDTGAATSSLDAHVISITGRKGAQTVRFKLIGDAGATIVELPVADIHRIRTSDASRPERRPTVSLEMCVAGQRFSAEVNLNDRSQMEHRMLLGRNVLAGRFVVDVERTTPQPAVCPGGP